MRVLVTAGSTEIPIDKVRVISNVFKGRTGAAIARHLIFLGMDVKLLTSAHEIFPTITYEHFRTFDDLRELMEREITSGKYDAIIHSAAVSDYAVDGVFLPDNNKRLLYEVERSKKLSSSCPQIYLRLVPTIKLVDKIRRPWGFTGKLVKFKLQVGTSDEELITIARKSMNDSEADFIVANCLEWHRKRAYIIGADGSCESVSREDLPAALARKIGGTS